MRKEIAYKYIHGVGIEIGALHSPLEIPEGTTVKYLDKRPTEELRQHYPELAQYPLVNVDIIDDGETLESIPTESIDFVIANHMIEHCQDPIQTIKSHLRVLKTNGVIYMAVPNKEYTFDKERPLTSIEHLMQDYIDGPEWSKKTHYTEWVEFVQKVPQADIETNAQKLMDMDYSIHFHVWNKHNFEELLTYCRDKFALPFIIEVINENIGEFICILKKA